MKNYCLGFVFYDRKVSREQHSDKDSFKIIVNGKEVNTAFPTIDYHDIVWRVKGAQDKNIIYSVTYSMKNGISGILYPNGPSVELENGMVFNCFHTGNA